MTAGAKTNGRASALEPILRAGRNCWVADAPVRQAGLLVDARDYYGAFYEAAGRARRYLLLAGWRFNSDVRLLRGKDGERVGGDVYFRTFLEQLCKRNPDLHIYILAWDFSLIFALQWELFQDWKFTDGPHDRLRFVYDSHHATAASHHQKFVVVDGQLGFVGGLDFCADDWDDREHRAHDPNRTDSGKAQPHPPYHDIQACVSGPAVLHLTHYFKTRWHKASGETLALPEPGEPFTISARGLIPIAADRVALSLNQPAVNDNERDIREIRSLYLDAIGAAEELIYIENQYFSSETIFEALRERMRAPNRSKLQIILVLPKQLPTTAEIAAMEPPRLSILGTLQEVAQENGHQLGLYYSAAPAERGEEVPVLIHSKVLLVDDRFLTVGSANMSNRSMGLDTELNVAWDASPGQHELIESIRNVRVDLLAEHCGLRSPGEDRSLLRDRAGLVARLDELTQSRAHRLRRLTREAIVEHVQWVGGLQRLGLSFDPGDR